MASRGLALVIVALSILGCGNVTTDFKDWAPEIYEGAQTPVLGWSENDCWIILYTDGSTESDGCNGE